MRRNEKPSLCVLCLVSELHFSFRRRVVVAKLQHNFWVFYLSTFGTTTSTTTTPSSYCVVRSSFVNSGGYYTSHLHEMYVYVRPVASSAQFSATNTTQNTQKSPTWVHCCCCCLFISDIFFGLYCMWWYTKTEGAHIGWYKIVYLPRKVNSIVQRTSAVTTCHDSSDILVELRV